ncbi:hypothetical protein GGI07_000575 [Coemansia sp. Benny D115]|nr:hypothetical protein GGI07_000575 [Coemansia sp. Benny D115]
MEIKWFDLPEEVEFTVDQVPLVMAHEFFDALPIHKFEKALGDKWSKIGTVVEDDSGY